MQKYLSTTLVGIFLVIAVTQLAPARSFYLVEAPDERPGPDPEYMALDENDSEPAEETEITQTHRRNEPSSFPDLGDLKRFELNGKKTNSTTTMEKGKRHVITCEVDTRKLPTIYWRRFDKNGKEIVEPSNANFDALIWNNKDTFAKVVMKYVIDCPMPHDEGIIYCVAEGNGRAYVLETKIKVKKTERSEVTCKEKLAPVITHSASFLIGIIGETSIIPCLAIGSSRLQTQWYHNNVAIDDLSSRYVAKKNGELVIKNHVFEDMGTYKCEVKSNDGIATASTFLFIYLGDVDND